MSTLYVYGCSMAAGSTLDPENPQKNNYDKTWGKYAADKLGFEYKNFAQGGASNRLIAQTAIDNLENYSKDDIVTVMWTYPERESLMWGEEEYDPKLTDDFCNLVPSQTKGLSPEFFEKFYTKRNAELNTLAWVYLVNKLLESRVKKVVNLTTYLLKADTELQEFYPKELLAKEGIVLEELVLRPQSEEDDTTTSEDYSFDGYHPSELMCERFGSELADHIRENYLNPTIISILLPTRGRREVLKSSLEGLVSKASIPGRLELLLGIDEDDEGIQEYLRDEVAPILTKYKVECKANVFKPIGYENLHQYVNHLAGVATGEWLFFWNDDGIMVTEGWDEVIDSYTGEFKLLAPRDNHNGHPYAIFPIVPRAWFNLMEHLSQNAQNDAWLSHIAYMLDIFERIDVEFIHDRADMTGNNDDATFQNRKYMEGNPSDPRDFGHPGMQEARVRTANKIAWYLEQIGKPSIWWQNVLAGKQDPFEKMKQNTSQNVQGAGQFQANDPKGENTRKAKIDDNATLTL